jgi:hypothetical protein
MKKIISISVLIFSIFMLSMLFTNTNNVYLNVIIMLCGLSVTCAYLSYSMDKFEKKEK